MGAAHFNFPLYFLVSGKPGFPVPTHENLRFTPFLLSFAPRALLCWTLLVGAALTTDTLCSRMEPLPCGTAFSSELLYFQHRVQLPLHDAFLKERKLDWVLSLTFLFSLFLGML